MSAADRKLAQFHLARQPGAADPAPLYSNFVQATATPEDFTIHFGWYAMPPLTEEPEGLVEVPIEPVARVVLPINLVSNLVALLQLQLANYEQNFGRVPEHPNKPPWMKEEESVDIGTD